MTSMIRTHLRPWALFADKLMPYRPMFRAGRGAPRRAVVVALCVGTAAAFAGGVAQAYFTTQGSGTGSASAGALQLQVQPVAAGDNPLAALVPGVTADAILKINNPNSYDVTLTSVTSSGPATAANSCTPTGVTFTNQTALSVNLPHGQTTLVHLPAAVSMDSTSASACQGTTFSIPVNVTVQK